MNLQLEEGDAAFARMSRETFRQAWQALYENCPWATGCQHPDFAETWYQVYRAAHVPVLVFAFDGAELTGLFTLALGHGMLTAAGTVQAEYQVCLALPRTGAAFLRKSLELLHARYPRHTLRLRYLPQQAPLEALRESRAFARYGELVAHARPYMRIDAAEIRQSLDRKTNKNLMNRLKRRGEVRFEKVEDPRRYPELLDEYIRQFDLRQAAMNDCAPFRADPRKRAFYLGLAQRGRLHVTTMTAGGEIVSLNLGPKDKDSIQIGISHSPLFSFCSPGKFHIYQLCLQLAQEGIAHFDLTPGAGYKMNFATDTDEVYELHLYPSLYAIGKAKLARKARALLTRLLQAGGISPTEAKLALGRWKKRLRLPRRGVGPVLQAQAITVAVNRLDDLLAYDEERSAHSLNVFLHAALRRLEAGQQTYTFTHEGRLLYAAWAILSHDPQQHAESWPAQTAPAQATVLHDVYCHPDADGGAPLQQFLEQVRRELRARHGATQVHLVQPPGRQSAQGVTVFSNPSGDPAR